ncbi:hypothetical protein KA977_15065 [Candidatus Dependentiae bacterium]|nr:hypothetical protein [Candidatus Dependentiae bacterium]
MDKDIILTIASIILTGYVFLRKQIKNILQFKIQTKYTKINYRRVRNEKETQEKKKLQAKKSCQSKNEKN